LVSHFHRPVLTSLFRKAWLELGTYALCRRTSYPLASNFPLIASVAGKLGGFRFHSRFTPAAPPTPSSFYVLRRASFEPKRNILRPRPQVTLPPLSRLRLLPLLNSHPLDPIMSVVVATSMSDARQQSHPRLGASWAARYVGHSGASPDQDFRRRAQSRGSQRARRVGHRQEWSRSSIFIRLCDERHPSRLGRDQ